jgi:hypothetical protein
VREVWLILGGGLTYAAVLLALGVRPRHFLLHSP